eukprot:CAMPEP_0204107926 /NCGR_PEP_ID=MMETSP0361-20130328/417_1 /ASSEMBLY_ACC=CAM_ASM_000343 /TAXON_ID=268821 /ORGANISM="Scrippsiella Hangoei, Strain SHTV-5" /LENGTH=77 /DNA_ID=CAMNT_0051057473 /DNA_START=49 /DNA_END=279 /DNA_ORIENTATION=+
MGFGWGPEIVQDPLREKWWGRPAPKNKHVQRTSNGRGAQGTEADLRAGGRAGARRHAHPYTRERASVRARTRVRTHT